jgi:chaperonin GroES
MQVLHSYVEILPDEKATETADGIILPEEAGDKPQVGEVLACGKNCKFVKKGDRVLYKKWGGNEFTEDEQRKIMVEEEDILKIL